jgi:hypothetical protein
MRRISISAALCRSRYPQQRRFVTAAGVGRISNLARSASMYPPVGIYPFLRIGRPFRRSIWPEMAIV